MNMIKYIYIIGFTILSSCFPSSALSQSKMVKINGGLQLGNPNLTIPPDGTIRWNGNDYEGWLNGEWVSLTAGMSSNPNPIENFVYDNDGNMYRVVTIGSQTWMRENLRTTTYNDSTIITESNLSADWSAGTAAWAWYQNNHAFDKTYGKIYNGSVVDLAANGNKNVCPVGWHVPTDADWTTLIDFLEGSATNSSIIGIQSTTVGGLLKVYGTEFWLSPNTGATNESGYTALPAGLRNPAGGFGNQTQDAFFWTSSSNGNGGIYIRQIKDSDGYIYRKEYPTGFGFAIRCVMD